MIKNILENQSLKNFNTFKVDVKAKYFLEVMNIDQLKEILNNITFLKNKKILILGLGANVLFVNNFDGLVLRVNIKGINKIKEDKRNVYLKIKAGEDWEKIVDYVVKKGWGGVENLAMIPGSFGGAVVQNIAAYGQNLKDVIVEVKALNRKSLKIESFKNNDCQFEYHSSIFKKKLSKTHIVLEAIIKLNKKNQLETSYNSRHANRDSILDELKKIAKPPYKTVDVYNAVVNIRRRKLPNIHKKNIGCAGSIFLNPFITKKKLKEIQKKIPNIQYYPADVDVKYLKNEKEALKLAKMVKIPAGWLLDAIGWSGKKMGNCYTPDKQALCLATNGKATGEEIYAVIKQMKKDFWDEYGIELEEEVKVVE